MLIKKRLPRILLFCGVFYLPLVQAQTPPLTLMTLNLANYNDHPQWDQRLDLIVDTISKAHASIVVLQEVRFSPDETSSQKNYQNMAEQILAKLNARGEFQDATLIFQPAMYYPFNPKSIPTTHYYPAPAYLTNEKESYLWEGLAIISKLKIQETGSYFLSQSEYCKDTNKRVTQYAKIQNGEQSFYLVNVHFGVEDACITSNMQETIAYLKQLNTHQSPMMMLGDFNATPDNTAFSLLKAHRLTDLWARFHPTEDGFTFPSFYPSKRIDYIWVNPTLAKSFHSGGQIQIIGNTRSPEGNFPSDHLGLAATF